MAPPAFLQRCSRTTPAGSPRLSEPSAQDSASASCFVFVTSCRLLVASCPCTCHGPFRPKTKLRYHVSATCNDLRALGTLIIEPHMNRTSPSCDTTRTRTQSHTNASTKTSLRRLTLRNHRLRCMSMCALSQDVHNSTSFPSSFFSAI